MPFTNFPNGLTSFGIPSLGGGWPISVPQSGPFTAKVGTVWFVNSTAGIGADGNDGLSPVTPLATIGRALTLANSGTGDTIYVFPGNGYSENVVVTKDYITIIGAQYAGYAKPDIGNTTGVALTVQAQGFRAIHCRFFSNDNSDAVIQNGNGFEYVDCFFDGNGSQTTKGLLRLVPALLRGSSTHFTASEGQVHGCYFRGTSSTAGALLFDTAAAPVGVGSTDNQIYNNVFTQNTGPDIATAKTGAGGVYSTQFAVIANNLFEDKDKAVYIDMTTNEDGPAASQTGIISTNTFCSDTITTTNVKMQATGFSFVGNVYEVGIKDGTTID